MLLDLMEVSGENLPPVVGGKGGKGEGKDTSHWKMCEKKEGFNGKKDQQQGRTKWHGFF